MDDETIVYDKTDFDLMRRSGTDEGGPVNWTPSQYQSMGLAEHATRWHIGGNYTRTIRGLILAARNAFARERGDESQCPWDENYRRRTVAARAPSLDAALRSPPPATAEDLVVEFVEKNNPCKREDIVLALAARRYSEGSATAGLASAVLGQRIYRKAFGWYAFGPCPKTKKTARPAETTT